MNDDNTITPRAFKDIVEGDDHAGERAVADPAMNLSQLVGGVDTETNELPVNEAVMHQNLANQQAGLPPISDDLVHPATVDEDDLSPLYPKMADLIEAAEDGDPIPVNENAVKSVEEADGSLVKSNRDATATGATAMRKVLDAVFDETVPVADDTEENEHEGALLTDFVVSNNLAISGNLVASSNLATAVAEQARENECLQRQIHVLKGFLAANSVAILGLIAAVLLR